MGSASIASPFLFAVVAFNENLSIQTKARGGYPSASLLIECFYL